MESSTEIVTTNKTTPNFLQAGCHFCRQTNNVKALMGIAHPISKT